MPRKVEGVVTLFGSKRLGEKTELQSPSEQLCHISHVQPPHQVESVHFDRSHADRQHFRNFTIRVSDRYQAKDVTLSRREQFGIELFL